MITVQGLSAGYGRGLIFDSIDIDFTSGISVLLGNNGAGKTTFLRSLLGLHRASSGRVLLDGRPLIGADAQRDTFRDVGWMPQSSEFVPGVSVHDTVRYAGWLRGIDRNLDEYVMRALELTDLIGLRRRSAKRLSGGETQRLKLACALVGEPHHLLMDEPTAGMDLAQQEAVRGIIGGLGADFTVLMTTHMIDDVLAVATRIVVLGGGQIQLSSDLPKDPEGRVVALEPARRILLGDHHGGG